MATPYYNASHGTPVVVQGQGVVGNSNANHNSVNNQTYLIPASAYHHSPENAAAAEWTKGEHQPRRCRDVFWAILFYVHIGIIVYATTRYVPVMATELAENYQQYGDERRYLLGNASSSSSNIITALGLHRWLEDQNGGNEAIDDGYNNEYDDEYDYNNNNNDVDGGDDYDLDMGMGVIMGLLGICGLAGFVLSSFALAFMMNFAEGLIKISLCFNIFVFAAVGILAAAAGQLGLAAVCLVGLLFSAYYAYVVWRRVPFAASNLVTAVTAVRANMGLSLIAFNNLFLCFLWSVWWTLAAVATTFVFNDCDGQAQCNEESSSLLIFLLLLSYYWTYQVIANVVHVTVAGTVGTWWFSPIEASGCFSPAIRDSLSRSLTTSFGSICLGSLIVAILQTIREMVHSMRNDDSGILLCCAECLIGCIESLVEYFNQWAFCFVGIYGYSFMEAGMNVMSLFKSRGWTAIITDVLVDTVLFMVSLGVGVITGLIGIFAGSRMVDLEGNDEAYIELIAIFLIGATIGYVMCNTLFSIVSSAVNTVIVCYAEAPGEFETNHPHLYQNMCDAWRQAWPMEFRY